MKKFISILFLLACAAQLWGQACYNLTFSYDPAGNRVRRSSTPCFGGGGSDETAALKAPKSATNSESGTKSLVTTLTAFPNPNNGVFQVQIENPQENGVLDLYDFVGRKVYSQGAPASVSMNVSHLVIGSYFLVYRTPEKVLDKLKFVIQ
jgi:hypothetical protein